MLVSADAVLKKPRHLGANEGYEVHMGGREHKAELNKTQKNM